MATKSNDDCYFYYYSTCKKAALCPFRHCEVALGTEEVCSDWQFGKCFNSLCALRHMEKQKDRSAIPCYWENQLGGCKKPHCVFRHYRTKKDSAEDVSAPVTVNNLISPMTSTPVADQHNMETEMFEANRRIRFSSDLNVEEEAEEDEGSQDETIVLPAVEPLVVNFDEESDSESCASSTTRHILEREIIKRDDFPKETNRMASPKRVSVFKRIHPNKKDEECLDFGIKTLQQLRNEREEKDPDDEPQPEMPDAEMINSHQATNIKNRLRLQTKTNNKVDFKIKTLDEIRNEKNYVGDSVISSEPASVETKENNNLSFADDAAHTNGDDMEASEDKRPSKRTRTKWSIYQPPKHHKTEKRASTLSPKKASDGNKNCDVVHIKTLAEIRAGRMKEQAANSTDSEVSTTNPQLALSSESKVDVVTVNDRRKHVADISVLAPFLSKRIKLSTAANKTNHESQFAKPSSHPESTSCLPSITSSSSTTTDVSGVLQILSTSFATAATESTNSSQTKELVSTSTPVMESSQVESSLLDAIVEPSASTDKCFEARMKRESRTSDVMDDEFDMLLGSDDEAEDDNPDIKEDELLLKLEQMINS